MLASFLMPLTYEINTRCWLRGLSETTGDRVTLANVPETEFQTWERLGFTHIWLMGVWTSGPRSRAAALSADWDYAGMGHAGLSKADIAASPCSISEYRVAEIIEGEAGLKQFRERLNARGIRLILDFVPNHLGLDHPWLKERPDLFVQSAVAHPECFAQETVAGVRWIAHGKDPYFPPWTDTAQLDYRNPATRTAMQRELLAIADQCDGVRCDMAMLVLNDVFEKTWKSFPSGDGALLKGENLEIGEFWIEAIQSVREKHPEFQFIAEVYWGLEARLQSMGFDFTYNKELYDDLVRRDVEAVCRRLQASSSAALSSGVHFLENHDEPRIASLLSLEEHRAAALLLFSLPGMRLLHEGQLTGARLRLPVQFARRPDEPEDVKIRGMYERLLAVIAKTSVGKGTFAVLKPAEISAEDSSARNVAAFLWWNHNQDVFLSGVNLAPGSSRALIHFPPVCCVGAGCVVTNLLAELRESFSWIAGPNGGLLLDFVAHEGKLLRLKVDGATPVQ